MMLKDLQVKSRMMRKRRRMDPTPPHAHRHKSGTNNLAKGSFCVCGVLTSLTTSFDDDDTEVTADDVADTDDCGPPAPPPSVT